MFSFSLCLHVCSHCFMHKLLCLPQKSFIPASTSHPNHNAKDSKVNSRPVNLLNFMSMRKQVWLSLTVNKWLCLGGQLNFGNMPILKLLTNGWMSEYQSWPRMEATFDLGMVISTLLPLACSRRTSSNVHNHLVHTTSRGCRLNICM